MDSFDSSGNFDISADGSQLLDVSDVLPADSSHSRQRDEDDDYYGGRGGGDLSLSDLSMDQTIRVSREPFSLLSKPKPTRTDAAPKGKQKQQQQVPASSRLRDSGDELDDGGEYDDNDDDEGRDLRSDGGEAHEEAEAEEDEQDQEEREQAKRRAEKAREEKLQNDIFILKKLNAAFETFNGALDEAGAANHRVAEQLVETDALLNKYIRILSKSEDFARLIFDEEWQGAEADEEQIRLEQLAAEQKRREAARERELAEQRERERQEQEERERAAREEKERLERDKKERLASRGGVRGVRGTRASMRGMASRGAAPSSRPESSTGMRSRVSVAPGTTGIPMKRGSSTVARGTRGRP